MTYVPHPDSAHVTIHTYGIEQETLERYIAGLVRNRGVLELNANRIQWRQNVRKIESAVCDNLDLTDEQLSVLHDAKLAYVGTYGDSLDDHEALRELNEQIEALTDLIGAANRLKGNA